MEGAQVNALQPDLMYSVAFLPGTWQIQIFREGNAPWPNRSDPIGQGNGQPETIDILNFDTGPKWFKDLDGNELLVPVSTHHKQWAVCVQAHWKTASESARNSDSAQHKRRKPLTGEKKDKSNMSLGGKSELGI